MRELWVCDSDEVTDMPGVRSQVEAAGWGFRGRSRTPGTLAHASSTPAIPVSTNREMARARALCRFLGAFCRSYRRSRPIRPPFQADRLAPRLAGPDVACRRPRHPHRPTLASRPPYGEAGVLSGVRVRSAGVEAGVSGVRDRVLRKHRAEPLGVGLFTRQSARLLRHVTRPARSSIPSHPIPSRPASRSRRATWRKRGTVSVPKTQPTIAARVTNRRRRKWAAWSPPKTQPGAAVLHCHRGLVGPIRIASRSFVCRRRSRGCPGRCTSPPWPAGPCRRGPHCRHRPPGRDSTCVAPSSGRA